IPSPYTPPLRSRAGGPHHGQGAAQHCPPHPLPPLGERGHPRHQLQKVQEQGDEHGQEQQRRDQGGQRTQQEQPWLAQHDPQTAQQNTETAEDLTERTHESTLTLGAYATLSSLSSTRETDRYQPSSARSSSWVPLCNTLPSRTT